MAEQASNIPTFKLVLVGDGGTGKVGSSDCQSPQYPIAAPAVNLAQRSTTMT